MRTGIKAEKGGDLPGVCEEKQTQGQTWEKRTAKKWQTRDDIQGSSEKPGEQLVVEHAEGRAYIEGGRTTVSSATQSETRSGKALPGSTRAPLRILAKAATVRRRKQSQTVEGCRGLG